ncbi:MAG: glutathione-disulfide reductase [Gammaproteobacteria bacterium]|nr:glutathione-disulfide reductase [Gammaproteobacteria bacterium]
MNQDFDYDLFVIGAGSGGVRAARIAAGFGARVGIAEERYFGGTCVNVGCIPKKLFVYGSRVLHDHRVAAGYGWHGPAPSLNWAEFIANKNTEIARLNGVYRRTLANAGCEIFESRASIVDLHTIELGDRRISARHVLIATGGWPYIPAIPGGELAITSNDVFHLPELPKRIVIVGGGYIAVEFAGVFAGFGCEVAQIYRGDLFMRGFDTEIREFLATQMREKSIDLRFNADVAEITRTANGMNVRLNDGSQLGCDCVIYATGRRPNSAGLGLADCGIHLAESGAIKVDNEYRTTVPSIYAIGDVTDRVNLTPVALAEGMVVARRLFGQRETTVAYEYIPTAVFSQPPIGTVGFTEEDARHQFGEISVFTSNFTPLRYTVSAEKERALMKLVVVKATDQVVGVHMCGEDAGEITQGFAVALRAGATKQLFDSTIGIHPTAAEEFVTMREPTR